MTLSDRSNKKERVWNDPPMPDDPVQGAVQEITLGANISPEVRLFIVAMNRKLRIERMIASITTATIFPIVYGFTVLFAPELTTIEILNMFIMGVVIVAILEVAHYKKQV